MIEKIEKINEKLTEEEVKLRFITPALNDAGWDKDNMYMERYFTKGKIVVRGKSCVRKKGYKYDYLLHYGKAKLPIAILEAKDNEHTVYDGIIQAEEYAKILNVPYAFSSNGEGFIFRNLIRHEEQKLKMSEFPTPECLYTMYKNDNNIDDKKEEVIQEKLYEDPILQKKPRYYQENAINKTIKAITDGKDRILLVCATGTGKTFIAFQIIYKLWQSKTKKKILYLADRNILIDQTMQKDFKPFKKVMTKIEGRKFDSSYEIYMSLYQQMVGENGEEHFREFKPDFFDLIVIDECHRGSRKEDSAWKKILEYFKSATHIGLTATPANKKDGSNYEYFGEPIYEYSLKQGIEDGFLAPYKVIRVLMDKDVEGYRPVKGEEDNFGYEIEDREYNIKDFDRTLVIDERTKIVAKYLSDYMRRNDRYAKTMVFCVDIEHAERMRQALIEENKDLYDENNKYIMRITGDNEEGKKQLFNFQDEESKYPVIAVTSKLLTTGVDVPTCKVIVIDRNFDEINGMIEFKQVIGRGTRVSEEYDKSYFTIIDFRNASRLFADPLFDGEPIYQKEVNDNQVVDENDISNVEDDVNDNIEINDDKNGNEWALGKDDKEKSKRQKYYINADVKILSIRSQFLDNNGKLITEDFKKYTKEELLKEYKTLEDFLNVWDKADKKQAIIDEMGELSMMFAELKDEMNMQDYDDFDFICHIAYDKKPLSKKDRVNNVKKRDAFIKYEGKAREIIDCLLDKYAKDGLKDLEKTEILQVGDFIKFGGPVKIVKLFGGQEQYNSVIKEIEKELYVA